MQEVLDAGKRSGEPGWPLPLWDDYKELIKSDVADIKNSGGRPAGTITAALFLKEFAEGYPWVHLDIAGTAYTESDLGTVPRGPTGAGGHVRGVRARASALIRILRVRALGCGIGLGLAGRGRFARPLGAQVRDTIPKRARDSTRIAVPIPAARRTRCSATVSRRRDA